MGDQQDVTEDRGFKALLSAYPQDALDFFAPEALKRRGAPAMITLLASESQLPDLGDASRFHDVALHATWHDGYQAVILLVEHWSRAREVDLRRVLWYVASLALQHEQSIVFPVLLVTDPGASVVESTLSMVLEGNPILTMQVQIVRITTDDVHRLEAMQNRIAAILLVLAMEDRVEAVLQVLRRLTQLQMPSDQQERFLPFLIHLGRMEDADIQRLHLRLMEDLMYNPITEIKKQVTAEGEARGEARGEAKGKAETVQSIIRSITAKVERGVMSHQAARDAIALLIDSGSLSEEQARACLARCLGTAL